MERRVGGRAGAAPGEGRRAVTRSAGRGGSAWGYAAEPSAAGCGVSASAPSGRTRRDSFSIPRFKPFSTAGGSAEKRSFKLEEAFVKAAGA